jgi:hypothetical protein
LGALASLFLGKDPVIATALGIPQLGDWVADARESCLQDVAAKPSWYIDSSKEQASSDSLFSPDDYVRGDELIPKDLDLDRQVELMPEFYEPPIYTDPFPEPVVESFVDTGREYLDSILADPLRALTALATEGVITYETRSIDLSATG